ncbi:porin, partial [Rivihabitans pingtungensis]|uniref:porin n=1 Tax=Rivihabitans pingtungensis TaxID=1054498 RepID=UPI00289BD9BA
PPPASAATPPRSVSKAMKKRKGAGSGSISDADYKANQWSLSGTYDLSKRTQAYAFYTRIDNKNAAKINFDSNGITGVAAGSNPTAFGIGLSHKF